MNIKRNKNFHITYFKILGRFLVANIMNANFTETKHPIIKNLFIYLKIIFTPHLAYK